MPAAELEPARDPALAVVAPANATVRVMQAAPVAVDEPARRVCDELAERCDAVLQRQRADDSFSAWASISAASSRSPSLLIVAPGPDMVLVARNTLRGGRRSGIATGVGVTLGLLVWTAAATLGLAALLRASEPAFLGLKIVGSLYLVYLGVRSLWDALRRTDAEASRAHAHPGRSSRVALREGLISNLGNPKIAVFFTSFLPQFVPGTHPSFGALLVLGLLFGALGLAWLTVYSFLVARAGDLLRRSGIRRALDGLTGAVLIGLGARLAFERR